MDNLVGGAGNAGVAGGPRSHKTKTETPAPTLGNLLLREITVTEEITFIDYIKSGTQMHFAVAIDFTASNGPPRDPHSLHFLDTFGGKPNPYEIALRAVGEIIQQYDSAGMFPAFGFGAKLPPNGDVSHQFSLNGNPSHPYCSSISEIVTHYRNCLATVTLYGPTNFSLVIHNTAQIASKFQDGKHYFILLIITDGIISDIHQTKNAIIDASGLPHQFLLFTYYFVFLLNTNERFLFSFLLYFLPVHAPPPHHTQDCPYRSSSWGSAAPTLPPWTSLIRMTLNWE